MAHPALPPSVVARLFLVAAPEPHVLGKSQGGRTSDAASARSERIGP